MIEIIFITGNRTKYVHLRYLAKGTPIHIRLFHELNYHATYEEPRICNREILLEQSVKSAIEQIKKAGIKSKKALFLIEDTSVIVRVLSAKDKEVPGVDIKYWMQENTFQDVNQTLTKLKDRGATVRSDMVLFNIEKTVYQQFSGFSQGIITEQEYKIKTQLLYPWLDNKTFNKWFVPNGEKLPISLLDIKTATKNDFRNHAFLKLKKFVESDQIVKSNHIYKNKKPKQEDLFPSLEFFVITGHTCAGKTTISQFISRKYNLLHLEASDYMHLSFYKTHGTSSDYKVEDFAEMALKENAEIVAEQVIKGLDCYKNISIVVSGFRSPDEVTYLIENLPKCYLVKHIHVEANFDIRLERFLARKRNAKDSNEARFEEINQKETNMGVENFEAEVVLNNESLDSFYEAFGNATNIKKQVYQSPSLGLMQKDIMCFLNNEYLENNKEQSYFSTTEISKKIGNHHKDNISRFFNQKYSPFFEICQKNGVNKYRLSNTGHSVISLYQCNRNPLHAN